MTTTAPHVTVERTSIGDVTHVRLAGVIDETFKGGDVAEGQTGHVIVDLGRIDRISSFGVRQWMEFSRQLPQGAKSLYIINATPMLVDQLATVEGFAGVAKVLSFLAPYECPNCNDEFLRRIDLRSDAAAISENRAPEHRCSKCDSLLEFADTPEEFFAFARHHTLTNVAPDVDNYLLSISAHPGTAQLHHTKIVEGDISFVRLTGELKADLNVRRVAGGLQGRVALDFGNVTGMDPAAAPKIVKLLEEAGTDARVFLWRAPLVVLLAIRDQKLPKSVEVATLWLRLPCKRCGEGAPQRILAGEYLMELKHGEALERPCNICGGPGIVPLHPELKQLLIERASADPPLAEFETIETRALSRSLQVLSQAAAPAPGHTPAPGSSPGATIEAAKGEKLQILKRIGQGGMAEVFLARHVGLKGFEKYVVLKKILPQFASQPEFVEMLFAEARSSARLNHPNIVAVHDVGMLGGAAYITMEYVRGSDLRMLMVGLRKAGVKLPIEHAVCIVSEIASALHYAHGYVDPTGVPHPVVHRDVSPANILISMDGAVKLSDFGIAKAVGESEQTQPGMIKGKIGYLPPEMLAGRPLDGRADIFSLGIVLFELLTSKMPFRRDNEAATMRALALDAAPDPVAINPDIPDSVAAVLLTALEKSPETRHQTGAAFRAALSDAANAAGLHSSPDRVATFFRDALGLGGQTDPGAPITGAPAPGSSPQYATPNPPRPPADEVVVGVELDESKPALGEVVPGRRPTPPTAQHLPSRRASQPEMLPVPPRPSEPGRRPSQQLPPVQAPAGGPRRPSQPELLPPPVAAPERRPSREMSPLPPRSTPAPAPGPSVFEPKTEPGGPPLPSKGKVKKGTAWPRVAAVGFGVAVGLGGAGSLLALAAKLTSGGDVSVQFAGLEGGERVYVSGVRLEANRFNARKNAQVLVAVGKNGELHRFGTVNATASLDVSSIPPLHVAPGGRAEVSVESDPRGCGVTIGGTGAKGITPMTTFIPAGTETQVDVSCPGLPLHSDWVLAAPEQKVAVTAKMFKEK